MLAESTFRTANQPIFQNIEEIKTLRYAILQKTLHVVFN